MLIEYERTVNRRKSKSLNPCSNGICSLSYEIRKKWCPNPVLILVLMEYAHWDSLASQFLTLSSVLILVLMEYAHWGTCKLRQRTKNPSLNPCSNGICSLSPFVLLGFIGSAVVLILVLMEYAHWEQKRFTNQVNAQRLNPCSNGICSLRNSKVRKQIEARLNPCSNGICSLSVRVVAMWANETES